MISGHRSRRSPKAYRSSRRYALPTPLGPAFFMPMTASTTTVGQVGDHLEELVGHTVGAHLEADLQRVAEAEEQAGQEHPRQRSTGRRSPPPGR